MITRSPRLGACPSRIESEKETPRSRLGPETPAKKRCHSASTLWYGASNVLQAVFSTSAATEQAPVHLARGDDVVSRPPFLEVHDVDPHEQDEHPEREDDEVRIEVRE